MRGVFFQDRAPEGARSPYRTDVALFVGFVDRRRELHRPGGTEEAPVVPVLPRGRDAGASELYRWLVREGWARGDEAVDRAAGLDELLDIPVPIDRFETFDRLFAWDLRPVGDGERVCDTYLGAAVRSFFAQGGRLCHVVRVGAPWPAPLTPDESLAAARLRDERLASLIPGAFGGLAGSPVDRATWRGVWALHGLPDVALVCLPDLPDVVRAPLERDVELPAPPVGEVAFVECTAPTRAVADDWQRGLRPPTCDDAGYAAWGRALARLAGEVALSTGALREVQVIAALPLPNERLAVGDLLRYLEANVGLSRPVEAGGLSTAFLQFVHPWLITDGGRRLPGAAEPPDGAFTGVLAGHALELGCHRSAAGRLLRGGVTQTPRLARRETIDPTDPTTLGGRVSLIGPTPAGTQVLSDVTTSRDPTFRWAHANRTVAAIVRVLRALGEEYAFSGSGEATWSGLRARVRDVLKQFWLDGALRGASEAEAFGVRCDRSTMTQDDLDAGRLVVMVELAVAAAIQRIQVVLTRTGDSVALERAA